VNHGFSSRNAHAGQVITGRVMQDVPLPNGNKIPEGAKILGTILAVSNAGKNSDGQITLRFDQLEVHTQKIAILTNLRALASFMQVEYAQIPETPLGFGTPYVWATTDLIGGDIKYGVGGPVTDAASNTIGEGTFSGVLVHLTSQPGSACRGELNGDDRLQALWVFSGSACGVYGMDGVLIKHAGRGDPVGEITLAASHGDVNVRGSSGLLLRVIR
jgi:hypothetical protein